MLDIHAHTDNQKELPYYQTNEQITSILNCATLAERDFNQQFRDDFHYLSGGIHPWDANNIERLAEIDALLASVPIIGEIGLDSVWCDVPMDQQLSTFTIQLAYGVTHAKPIILHTKGAEKIILRYLAQYPQHHFLVHWYSSSDLALVKQYLNLPNVYFSLGPDFFKNQAVQNLLTVVPIERLFIESDGLGAMKWAFAQGSVTPYDYLQYLEMLTEFVVHSYQLTKKQLETQFMLNFQNFINIKLAL